MRVVPALTRRGLRAAFHACASTSSSLYTAGGRTRTALVRREATTAVAAAGQPLRVCVVGSGPAGFYVTKYLLKASEYARRKSKYNSCAVCWRYFYINLVVWPGCRV